jgi:8-oxo-dGTP pyrophosphatase MutT (NUDIX family)
MANIVADKHLHRIVLTAIIYDKRGRFLITKRSPNQKAYPSKWTVPGGGVEVEDYINSPKTTSDAWYSVLQKVLKREVKEETNLEISNIEYLTDMFFVRPDDIPVLILSYFAKYVSGDVILEENDSVEYTWVTVKDAEEYDLIAGILDEIRQVDAILNKRN